MLLARCVDSQATFSQLAETNWRESHFIFIDFQETLPQSGIVINFDNHVTSQHDGHCRNRRISYTIRFIRFSFGTGWVIYPQLYSMWTRKERSSPISKMAVAVRVERLEMLAVKWDSA